MTRQTDIAALLAKAEKQLSEIMREYELSLHQQSVAAALKVDIKNYCENLRSVLDYIAHGVRERYCTSANPKDIFYFPICPDQTQFISRTRKSYPALETTAPSVWAEFEKSQPYQPAQAWLGHLNRVNNENKHGALVAQTRQETTTIKADIAGGGAVSWNPSAVKFGSGVLIGGVPVNPSTQMPISDPRLKVTKTTWVDFQFDGIGVSAIALLKDALAGIKAINTALALHI
jgi:hypothetical protein